MKNKISVNAIAILFVITYVVLAIVGIGLACHFIKVAMQTNNPWLITLLSIVILLCSIVTGFSFLITRVIVKRGPYSED